MEIETCTGQIFPPAKPMKLEFPAMKNTVRKITPNKKVVVAGKDDSSDVSKSDAEILSLLSPSSVFDTSKLPESIEQLIHGVVLSCWDNILGPKVHHVWTNEKLHTFSPSVLSQISSHTLNGEICRDSTDSAIDAKFYRMSDIEFIVTAFIFTAKINTGLAIHSLAIILPESVMQKYIPYHNLCVEYMKRHVAKLRILLAVDSKDVVLNDFSLYIHDLVELLNSLQVAGLPVSISSSDTAFHPEHSFEDNFLKKAIASHLITCGHSVVIGKVPSRINLMVSTLGLFLSPKERLLSRFVQEDQGWNYSSHLAVQGMIIADSKKKKLYVSEVLSGTYPTTVIDMPKREVSLMPPCHEHNVRRYEMLRNELTCLWLQQKEPASGIYPTSTIFQPADFKETLVSNFYDELQPLQPCCGMIEEYVEQFTKQLDRKALALIKFAESETQEGRYPFKTNTKKLRQYLCLPEEGDFRIVLATAEKLKPGMHSVIFGDPSANWT
ncbi:guanine nucleotide exchange factor C9orf72-like isoform X2 [Tubulanus polymorphus]|uniref:guanine nucleotide exchange factor C9orf72-like isoform X2 n=1 Tax=Tubulanus polymorphus TaxID=672921 RepID=UPI003DA2E6C4